jgi:antitoxin component of MazEF toxin-antitoxin module
MTLRANLTVASDGSLELPANLLAELGVQHGGKLLSRVENNTLILEPVNAAVRRAQEMVRRYMPDGKDIIAEMIAERRAEAERE